jgi:hypothetical protein
MARETIESSLGVVSGGHTFSIIRRREKEFRADNWLAKFTHLQVEDFTFPDKHRSIAQHVV